MKVTLSDENKEQLDGLFEETILGGIREDLQYGAKYSTDDLSDDELCDIEEDIIRQGTTLAAKYLIKKLQEFIKENQY